jgi:hypothetical protein
MERKTRSGRTVKEPQRYEPVEKVTDDYDEDEYDSNVDIDASDDELDEQLIGSDDDEEESEDDEEDADGRGNLKDFVAYSDDEEDTDSDYEEDDDSAYEETDDEYEDSDFEETDDEEEEGPASEAVSPTHAPAADQEEKSVPVE